MTYFKQLRKTVDGHRCPISEDSLRRMSGVSTFVARAAETTAAPRMAASVFPIPAELSAWDPLRETHYVFVPEPTDEGEPWPFVLSLVEAAVHHFSRADTDRKVAGSMETSRDTLRKWLEDHGPSLSNTKLRRSIAACQGVDELGDQDDLFWGLSQLAQAATGTRWILWDPFRNRVIAVLPDDDAQSLPTRWFLRDEEGRVGLVMPFTRSSPTWDATLAAATQREGIAQWQRDKDEWRRLDRMTAADLKVHLKAAGRSKKADLLRQWYERIRQDDAEVSSP